MDEGKLGYGFTSADELEEISIGPRDKPRPTFISKKLNPELREPMIVLLKEYADCFSWDYTEMPGLDRSIVEHRLPLKLGFWPFQQRARQMKAEVLEEVKKEVEKMLEAGFIRTCRYAEWISSVVPVQKKDGRWRVCMDFRDLNRATPKDEYPMPVVSGFIRLPTERYTQGGRFSVGMRRDQELEGTDNTRFRQVQAAICVMPYVLYDGLYCLDVDLVIFLF
jgi:hypothetical protein